MKLGIFALGAIATLLLASTSVNAAYTRWHELEAKQYSFEHYVAEFGKSYEGAEYRHREAVFNANLAKIKAHNRDTTKTWKEGVNHLTDLTPAEFKARNGYQRHAAHPTPLPSFASVHETRGDLSALPAHKDWRDEVPAILTAVKDQGQCGSCWSFATAETIEAHWAMATGNLVQLSEQQVANCSPNPKHCGGTGGCQGGTAEIGFGGVIAAGGLSSEWTYPYNSYFGTDFKCKLNGTSSPKREAQVSGYVKVPTNSYAGLMEAINVGPVAISVDASNWQHYESGVYDGCNQTSPTIDHAVQLVGYTTYSVGEGQDDVPVWIVRNSWSPTFGEGGFIMLRRYPVGAGESPRCAYDTEPGSGSGCSGGPPKVLVCGTCGILYDNAYPTIQ